MKKQIKSFILGFAIAMLLLGGSTFASSTEKMIGVMFNLVNIEVNGEKVKTDNIAYKGTTYLPLRDISEMLGKEVSWNKDTNTASINDSLNAKVTRVVDGDTIVVDFHGKEERVRLIGVDTPESVHPDKSKNVEFGKISSDFTKSKLEGKEIKLEFDVQERDKYGRLLAYVYLEGKMFNRSLLEEGYANIATFPPNVKYVKEFTEIERIARDEKVGLWVYEDDAKVQETVENTQINNANHKDYGLKVKAGSSATASIVGTPNTVYTISVYYSSGASKSKDLIAKKSDKDGNVSWTWNVGSKTKAGKYSVVISGDKTVELELEVIN